MSKITSKIETITPEIASHYLKNNKENRPLSTVTIENYADAMIRGEWMFNGDAIRIDEDGNLLDGQHRLYAIISSGINIESLVIKGLPREVFSTIDIGRGRRKADFISLLGYKYATQFAAALEILYIYRKNNFKFVHARAGKKNLSTQQIIELAAKEEGLIESIKIIKKIGSMQNILPPAIAAAFHYIVSEKEPERANLFFEQLYSGANLSPNSPILTLRNQQLNYRINRLSQNRKALIIGIIKCWNAYESNESLACIKFNENDEVPNIQWWQPELKLSA
jgi:hypothetical protein